MELRPGLGQGVSLDEEAVPADSERAGEKSDLFEHPAVVLSSCPRRAGHRSSAVPKWFFHSLLERQR